VLRQKERKMKVAELKKRCKEYTAELIEAVKKEKNSERLLNYFEFCSRFHNYSFGNRLLIWAYMPDATFVAGFKTWQKMGRFVKRGERGIPIFAPMRIKIRKKEDWDPELDLESLDGSDTAPHEEDVEIITRFKVVYVFDVSQTEGEPLPETPDTLAVQGDASLLLPALEKAVRKQAIELAYVESIGGSKKANGCSSMGKIRIISSLDTAQRFSVVVHEFAHELLHGAWERKGGLPRKIMELEAEATAFVVTRHFGLETKAPTYLALYRVEEVDIMASLDRIVSTASRIIEGIHKEAEIVQNLKKAA